MELREGDVVLCTVSKIEGTSVFVNIEDNGSGSLVMSEVAAGRIRNLREYVSPNKKIVCKVLRVVDGDIQLSLRRVTGKERDEVLDRFKKEKNFISLLRNGVKDYEKVIVKIKEKYKLWEFFDEVKGNPEILKNFIKKEEAETLAKIIVEKEKSEKEAKQTVIIRSQGESGLLDIREVLDIKDSDIKYLGSSKFSVCAKGPDFKEANLKVQQIIKKIENKAKEKKIYFEVK